MGNNETAPSSGDQQPDMGELAADINGLPICAGTDGEYRAYLDAEQARLEALGVDLGDNE